MAGTVFTPAQAHHAQALTPKHQAFGGARQLAKCLVDGASRDIPSLLVTMCLVVFYLYAIVQNHQCLINIGTFAAMCFPLASAGDCCLIQYILVSVLAGILMCCLVVTFRLLQHYCDELSQGIGQATSDARTLHDSIARLAAACTPHDLSAPPAAAAIAPATASAIKAAAAAASAAAATAPAPAPAPAVSNVVAYADHSTGNIYRHGNGQQKVPLVRTPSPHAN
jgi:hypothetical protein